MGFSGIYLGAFCAVNFIGWTASICIRLTSCAPHPTRATISHTRLSSPFLRSAEQSIRCPPSCRPRLRALQPALLPIPFLSQLYLCHNHSISIFTSLLSCLFLLIRFPDDFCIRFIGTIDTQFWILD